MIVRGASCRAAAVLLGLLLADSRLPAESEPAGGSLTIERAYELAGSASESIRMSELGVSKSQYALAEATSAELPRLTLQAQGSYLLNPPPGLTVTKGLLGTIPGANGAMIPVPTSDLVISQGTPNEYFDVNAALSQPLFAWGKIKDAVDLAAIDLSIARSQATGERRDIVRETNRAYFSALLAERSLAVLDRIRATVEDIVTDRNRSMEQGQVNREAVLSVEAELASVDFQIVGAQQSRKSALASLSILTGAGDPVLLASEFRSSLPRFDESALVEQALGDSTDLSVGKYRAAQAQKRLAIEEGSALLKPDLSLNLTFDINNAAQFGSATVGAINWDLGMGLGVKVNLFDGLQSVSRIQEARTDLSMAGLGIEENEDAVRLAVRNAVDSAVRADAEVKLDRAKEADAREQFRNAQASFDRGVAARETFRSADLALGSAQLDLLLAEYHCEEAIAELERLTGEELR